MLTITLKAYSADAVVNIKPIYLKKLIFLWLFTIIKDNYNILLQRKCSLKVRSKKVWVVKIYIPMT